MTTITASIPCSRPPAWAVLERRLMDAMSDSVFPYLQKYTRAEDGELIWRDTLKSRDGADDFYESFYNWPLLYLLGGADHLLELAHRQWEAVTRQLTRLGQVYHEYERGYDQFHQEMLRTQPIFARILYIDASRPRRFHELISSH